MLFLLLPASKFSNQQRSTIQRLFKFSALLLIFAGIISLFFPYRLSTFVMDGFRYVEGRRLPHLIAVIPSIELRLFLPIGFQNTHLTYGALLALFIPSLFLHLYRLLSIRSRKASLNVSVCLFYLIFSFAGLVLLLLNQSRSIWIGLLLSILLLVTWKKAVFVLKQNAISFIGIATFLIILIFILYQANWLFKRSIDQLFTKQTLENQRAWIHKANFSMLQNHILGGIGSGNYKAAFEDSYDELIEEKPYLYYEISITPKVHAHHDLIHFFIIGGILSGILFLILWYVLLDRMLLQTRHSAIFIGIYAVFIGGMFQCYFLDDETLLPLFAIFSLTKISRSKPVKLNKTAISLFMIPAGISLLLNFSLSRSNADQLFIHRTRDLNNLLSPIAQKTINGIPQNIINKNEENFYFKLEGCLSQVASLHGNSRPRQKPLTLSFLLPENETSQTTFPIRYKIELRKRDSFDQDQRFQVHSESVFRVQEGEFHRGENRVQIDLPIESAGTEIHFWDLGIMYIFELDQTERWIPKVELKPDCD